MPGMDAIYFIQPSKEKYHHPYLFSFHPWTMYTTIKNSSCVSLLFILQHCHVSIRHVWPGTLVQEGIYLFQFHYPQRIGQSHQK
jgi:hypothetical protein